MTRLTLPLACAGLLALSVPVVAGQADIRHALRGSFSGTHLHAGPYVAPQSWQQRRLQSRLLHSAPPPITVEPTPYVVSETFALTDHLGPHSHAGQAFSHGEPVYLSAQASGPRDLGAFRGLSQPQPVRFHAAEAAPLEASRGSYHLGGPVRTSVLNSRDMLDFQEHTTGKALTLLANRASGVLQPDSLYLGGHLQGSLMYQTTDVDGQFPLLSRFPFFSRNTDDEAAVFAINNAALSFTSTFGDWTTVHLQPEYSETEFRGDQDEFQLRKAFVVFGNLERSPFYAAFGRKTIDFGNFDSYNAFTQNEGQHFFWAVSDQPVAELGFYSSGWKLSASAFSGGRQLRVAFADEDNNIANYAASVEKEFLLPGRAAFTVGGSYLHDTIYRDNFTAHTFAERQLLARPDNFIDYRNSAVSGFAEFNSPGLDAMVEYTSTLEPWAAAIPQTPDGVPLPQFLIDPLGSTTDLGNIRFDDPLSTLVAQVRFKPVVGGRRMAIAASGSWGEISDGTGNVNARGVPTSFESNQQHAVSVEYPISPFLDVGAEYVFNKGFIPFVAPQQVSNDQTEAHAINLGFKARF